MDLLRRAHDRAYRFPPDFAGFTATVQVDNDPPGTLVVRGRRDSTLTLDSEWAREQVASILGHRWSSDFAAGDGRYERREEADGNPTGTLVRLAGEPMSSAYRVTDDHHIAEVHRTVGDRRFTIVVSTTVETGDGRLPQAFSVYYWSVPAGDLVKADQYRDSYVKVDGVWLPERRTVTTADGTGLNTRVLRFADHQLAVA